MPRRSRYYFSNEKVSITKEQIENTPEHFTIYSGIGTPYLENLVSTTNRKLVKLFDRDDVAIYNSIPTVEGTLMMVIQHTDYRTMSVARAFQSLGAHVKVGARRSEHIARITEMMFSPFHMQDIEKEVENIDIVINTIPHLVVTANVISKCQLIR